MKLDFFWACPWHSNHAPLDGKWLPHTCFRPSPRTPFTV